MSISLLQTTRDLPAKRRTCRDLVQHCITYISAIFYSQSTPACLDHNRQVRMLDKTPVVELQLDPALLQLCNIVIHSRQSAKTATIQGSLGVAPMVGRRGMLVLLPISPKLIVGTPIARPMRRRLILVVRLVGILGEPGVVRVMAVLVSPIHAVPLLAIPTAAVVVSVAAPITCTNNSTTIRNLG